MNGKMAGETIYMKTATTHTTIREICVWISQRLGGPANKVHRVTLALGEYGCGTLALLESDSGEIDACSVHEDLTGQGDLFADSFIGGFYCYGMPIPCHYEGIPSLFFPQRVTDFELPCVYDSRKASSAEHCRGKSKRQKTLPAADANKTLDMRQNPHALESVLDAETINSIMSKLGKADPSLKGQQLAFCREDYHKEVSEAHERELHVQTKVEKLLFSVPIPEGITLTFDSVWSDCRVREFKRILCQYTCLMPEQSLLSFAKKLLQDDHTLGYYGIGQESCLGLFPSMTGGGGRVFVDVSNESAMVRYHWSSEAPSWREVSAGLCIEGRCTNRKCAAYKQMVIHNNHFRHFDLLSSDNAACPNCEKKIKPLKPAFSNCFYKVVGVKADELCTVYNKPWTKVGNEYIT